MFVLKSMKNRYLKEEGDTLRIVICDDDEGCCSRLDNWLYSFKVRENVDLEVSIYNRAETLLKHMREGQWFDVIFLDIELPQKTGVELAREIRQKMLNDQVFIIFISGQTKYCLELFELEPLNFHQKPLVKGEIIKDIEKIMERKSVQKQVYKFSVDGLTKGIFLRDIMYIEAMGNMVEITAVGGKKIVVRESLLRLIKEFENCHFCQCHRSFIVNLCYVHRYRENYLYMKDETKVPVGKTYLDFVKRQWIRFDLEDW